MGLEGPSEEPARIRSERQWVRLDLSDEKSTYVVLDGR
jgi:hypothetical protein